VERWAVASSNLIGERPVTAAEHSPRGGCKQNPLIGGHVVRNQEEHTVRLAEHFAGGSSL
jgi:hypothetical protein